VIVNYKMVIIWRRKGKVWGWMNNEQNAKECDATGAW